MKLTKNELFFLLESIDAYSENGSHKAEELAENVHSALYHDELDIEGYERVEWIRFDPNDPKTFPPKGKDQFLTLSNDGEIRSMRFDFDAALVWKYHISHWRPLPNLPVEKEAKNEAE